MTVYKPLIVSKLSKHKINKTLDKKKQDSFNKKVANRNRNKIAANEIMEQTDPLPKTRGAQNVEIENKILFLYIFISL